MRYYLLWLFFFIGLIASGTNDVISRYGKTYKTSSDDAIVEIIYFKSKNNDSSEDVLIKISGRLAEKEGIDGKMLKYEVVSTGKGFDYRVVKKVRPSGKKDYYTRLTSRSIWGSDWTNMQLYFGNKSYNIYPDKEATQKMNVDSLYKEYLKTTEKK